MVLPSTVMSTHYKVKTKPYDPQDNRFYQHEIQPVKQDRVRETLPDMEILDDITYPVTHEK